MMKSIQRAPSIPASYMMVENCFSAFSIAFWCLSMSFCLVWMSSLSFARRRSSIVLVLVGENGTLLGEKTVRCVVIAQNILFFVDYLSIYPFLGLFLVKRPQEYKERLVLFLQFQSCNSEKIWLLSASKTFPDHANSAKVYKC